MEYVRVCSAYGAGFFYIPGTDTCLRISGRVRAEYRVQEAFNRADAVTGYRARGRLNFDARTQTAYGTLRTFIRYELTYNSGAYVQGFGTSGGIAGVAAASGSALTVDLNKAFIQWGGLLAGRATSVFDFYANDLNWSGLPTGSDTYGADPVVLAYTASFGQGFYGTISIEDPAARRITGTGPAPVVFGGQRMPEIVAAVGVDQAWGSFKVAGAVHQLFALNRVPLANPAGANPNAGTFVDTEYGFAIMAGLKLNLPQIAPGDVLWLQATYANGASNYSGLGTNLANGRVNVAVGDAYVDAFGDVKKVEAFNFTAAFLHYWTPQIRQAIFGTYGRVEVPRAVASLPFAAGTTIGGVNVGGVFAAGALTDFDYWQIGSNLIWSPVRDLDIGVEVLYRNVDPKGRILAAQPIVAGVAQPLKVLGDEGTFEGRLRIQRDF